MDNAHARGTDLRFAPDVRIDHALARSRLLQCLAREAQGPARMTMLCAPAGLGKTTLLAQHAAALRGAGVPIVWVNCEPTCACTLRESIAAALKHEGRLEHADESSQSPAHTVSGSCQQAGPCALFIDGYEKAMGAVSDAQLAELAVTIPHGMRIYVAGRNLPEACRSRHRMGGHVHLIDAAQLLFTLDEASQLLGTDWPSGEVEGLMQDCGGWPAALHLAKLDERARNVDLPLHAFRWPLFLAERALEIVANEDRQFLVETSVLPELRVGLADAVRGSTDSARYLHRLELLHPLVVLDLGAGTARVVPMLRRLLLDIAQADGGAESMRQRHLRAADAYRERGELVLASDCALSASRPDRVADMLVAQGAVRLVADLGLGLARKLLHCIPREMRFARPRLRLLNIACLLLEENACEAELDFARLVDEVRQGQCQAPPARLADDPAFMLDLALVECFTLVYRAEHELMVSPWEELERACRMASVQYCEDWRLVGLLLPILILFLHRYGPLSAASRHIEKIERLYLAEASPYNRAWVRFNVARSHLGMGHVAAAARVLDHLQDDRTVARVHQRSFADLVDALRAQAAYLIGDLDRAADILHCVASGPGTHLLEVLVAAHIDLARCEWAQGQEVRALARLMDARRLASEQDQGLPHLDIQGACTSIAWLAERGETSRAALLAGEIRLSSLWSAAATPRALPWTDVEAIGRAMVALALAQRDAGLGAQCAASLLELAHKAEDRIAILRATLLQSRASRAAGDLAGADRALSKAMGLASDDCVSQPFVDECIDSAMLRGAHPDAGGSAKRLIEQVDQGHHRLLKLRLDRDARLTVREREVVLWLGQSLTTKEVGRRLQVSPETVKQHLKAIFLKLGVNSRHAVVAIYRQGLCAVAEKA